jgi:hypothetical protein
MYLCVSFCVAAARCCAIVGVVWRSRNSQRAHLCSSLDWKWLGRPAEADKHPPDSMQLRQPGKSKFYLPRIVEGTASTARHRGRASFNNHPQHLALTTEDQHPLPIPPYPQATTPVCSFIPRSPSRRALQSSPPPLPF